MRRLPRLRMPRLRVPGMPLRRRLRLRWMRGRLLRYVGRMPLVLGPIIRQR
jgi:hypothetical protein